MMVKLIAVIFWSIIISLFIVVVATEKVEVKTTKIEAKTKKTEHAKHALDQESFEVQHKWERVSLGHTHNFDYIHVPSRCPACRNWLKRLKAEIKEEVLIEVREELKKEDLK